MGSGSTSPDFIDPGGELSQISVFPNPATNTLNISIASNQNLIKEDSKQTKQKAREIKQLQITNKTGIILRQENYGSGNKKITLDIGSLKPDIYLVRIFDGERWHISKVVVEQ